MYISAVLCLYDIDIDIFPRTEINRWMDGAIGGVFEFNVSFNNILVISGQWYRM